MSDYLEARRKWGLNSQSQARIHAADVVARTEEEVVTNYDFFNQQHDRFPVRNGTINLRTGKLEAHSREDGFTWISNINFAPDAKCPAWDGFLRSTFEEDKELIRFVQRSVGYIMTGSVREHAIFILFGRGRNGKSTFMTVLLDILGSAGSQIPIQSFLIDRAAGAAPRPDIIRMRDKRLIASSEVNKQQTLDSALMKGLAGGDRFIGRNLFSSKYEEFVPTFKIALLVNDLPIVSEGDEALFLRLYPIPFNRVFAPCEQDKTLGDRLNSELEGILSWCAAGAEMWFREGLNPPRSVLGARDSYRREMSPLACFLEDCCIDGNINIAASDLFQAYFSWAIEEGLPPISQNAFGRTLTRMGYRSEKNGTKRWRGLTLRSKQQGEN